MLENGCYGYLANIVDKTKENWIGLKDIPIVREYLTVLPEDLTNLSPDREVEFFIALIPGAAPISKAPYRLVPRELKELKTQV